MTPTRTLPIPLYHGTSTLFLAEVLSLGLGGKDPLADLNLHEFIKELNPIIQQHLRDTDAYSARSAIWNRMVNQEAGRKNYQHGQTYLTPSVSTAVRYASNTLDFLQILCDRNVSSVRTDLFRKFPTIFNLLDISPAPILFRLDGLAEEDLLGEDGESPRPGFDRIREMLDIYPNPEKAQTVLQQVNFRLKTSVSVKCLRAWAICITKFHSFVPQYNLYELALTPGQSASSQ